MTNYILDTTILLYDAHAIDFFKNSNIVIPLTTIEEIDRFKKDVTETGKNAREASRIIDSIRKNGILSNGVKNKNNSTVFVKHSVEIWEKQIPNSFREKRRDLFILSVALQTKNEMKGKTVLLTKDIYLRIKAETIGISSENYETERFNISELYSGHREISVKPSLIESLKNGGHIALPKDTLLPNQYVTLHNQDDENDVAYGRFCVHKMEIVPLIQHTTAHNYRIVTRNREQAFALDALLNEDIKLITLAGKAGTGKTMLAVAAGIFETVDENRYDRILIARPTLPMGQDIGYLPGTVEEKLKPWMYPIADNVELIMQNGPQNRKTRGLAELMDMGILVIEPLTYIRGRSIHNQYLIIDESQNLTPHEIKTIITRAGEGTKIVLTGDPYQIDNPYIDSTDNGLTLVVEKFKTEKVSAHITLTKGERSKLSELASDIL